VAQIPALGVERLLLSLNLVMRKRILVGVVVAGVLGLALVTFGSAFMPETAQHKVSAPGRPLTSSRFLMLLPDGKVELTDAWARRVYQWDGQTWVELEVARLPAARAEVR
jgi:hypothetical protein